MPKNNTVEYWLRLATMDVIRNDRQPFMVEEIRLEENLLGK
jgi:hypothetical protein